MQVITTIKKLLTPPSLSATILRHPSLSPVRTSPAVTRDSEHAFSDAVERWRASVLDLQTSGVITLSSDAHQQLSSVMTHYLYMLRISWNSLDILKYYWYTLLYLSRVTDNLINCQRSAGGDICEYVQAYAKPHIQIHLDSLIDQ